MSSRGWFDAELLPLSTFDAEIDPLAWFDRSLVGFDDPRRISQSPLAWFDSGVVDLAWFDADMDPLHWFGDEGGPDDFPTLTALGLSLFVAAPYTASPWPGLQSTSSSTTRTLVSATGVPAPTAGAAVNGRTSAYYDSTATSGTDPTTQALTLLLRDYAGTSWTSTASAGLSGGRVLANINAPSVGASLGGHASAAFTTAASTQLDSSGGGETISSYLGAGAGSGWFVVKMTALGADPGAGSRYLGPALFDDNGGTFAQLNVDASGANLALIDGVGYAETAKAAVLSVGTVYIVQFRYDGANMYCRVNNGAWVSQVNGGITAGGLGNTLRLGRGGAFADVLMYEVGLTDTTLSVATLDGLALFAQTRYASSFGF